MGFFKLGNLGIDLDQSAIEPGFRSREPVALAYQLFS